MTSRNDEQKSDNQKFVNRNDEHKRKTGMNGGQERQEHSEGYSNDGRSKAARVVEIRLILWGIEKTNPKRSRCVALSNV